MASIGDFEVISQDEAAAILHAVAEAGRGAAEALKILRDALTALGDDEDTDA